MAALDYKFAEYKDKVYDTYKTQLYCYAWLISSNFGKPVQRSYLVYTRSRNKLVEIPIGTKELTQIEKSVTGIQYILEKNHYPKATKYKRRCVSCTYRNICTQ